MLNSMYNILLFVDLVAGGEFDVKEKNQIFLGGKNMKKIFGKAELRKNSFL